MRDEIRKRLETYSDEKYRDFSAGLIPNVKKMLGVRLPVLRKIAGEIAKGDWRSEVERNEGDFEDIYFEETMLRALIIGYGTRKSDVSAQEGLKWLEKIIPYIDNWSVCDSFCNSFVFASKNRAEVWQFLQKYLYSDKEFEVRVSIILLLNQFLRYDYEGRKNTRKRVITMADLEKSEYKESDCPYLERILNAINREFSQGYYARMAAAWTLAEAMIIFPYEVNLMLTKDCMLDKWTYNKTLSKICESRNPDLEVKQYIKTLRN